MKQAATHEKLVKRPSKEHTIPNEAMMAIRWISFFMCNQKKKKLTNFYLIRI